MSKTVRYAPNGNVTTFSYGYREGNGSFIHTTYNEEYITGLSVKTKKGKTLLSGSYYPAMGMRMVNLDKKPCYRFDVSVNEEGNYVFDCKGVYNGATLEKGVYTFDPNGECLTQPE